MRTGWGLNVGVSSCFRGWSCPLTQEFLMVRISDPDKRRRGRQGELERKDARFRGDLLVQLTSYLGLPVILKFKGWVVGGSAL